VEASWKLLGEVGKKGEKGERGTVGNSPQAGNCRDGERSNGHEKGSVELVDKPGKKGREKKMDAKKDLERKKDKFSMKPSFRAGYLGRGGTCCKKEKKRGRSWIGILYKGQGLEGNWARFPKCDDLMAVPGKDRMQNAKKTVQQRKPTGGRVIVGGKLEGVGEEKG